MIIKLLIFFQGIRPIKLYINDFDWKRIKDAIIEEMTCKRLYHQTKAKLIWILVFTFYLKDKTDITAYTDYYGGYGYGRYGWGYGPYGVGGATTTVSEYDYTEGTLILDVLDTKAKSLLYQGIAVGTIKEGNVDREKRVHMVMGKSFCALSCSKSQIII